jgi:hypothetical protein
MPVWHGWSMRKTIRFFGDDYDDHGMPNPYFSYVIFSDDFSPLGAGGGVASVMPLQDGKYEFVSVTKGGLDGAMAAAVEKLKRRHDGLRVQETT